jgi:putative phosphoesterase
MRMAVVSDIHGNLTALEAVIADLRETGVDLVVHGGDLLSGGGARSAAVVDRIRELKWPGVYGNAEEMCWAPHRVSEALQRPELHRIRDVVLSHTIPTTLREIGDERLEWLKTLPLRWSNGEIAVVHAGPDDAWHFTPADAPDEELERVYSVLGASVVVYGHIHQPFVRRLASPAAASAKAGRFTVVNSGAVSLSFDGDPRASYALIDGNDVEIRRVAYDVDEEIRLLRNSDDPFAPSTIETLRTGRYVALT